VSDGAQPTLDELNAALQIAGQRLLEAERARTAAQIAFDDADRHWQGCLNDLVPLLKAKRDLSGERGKRTVWLPDARPDRFEVTALLGASVYRERGTVNVSMGIQVEPGISIDLTHHKAPLKKAAAICRRLLARGAALT
jgi:hypothetical protein